MGRAGLSHGFRDLFDWYLRPFAVVFSTVVKWFGMFFSATGYNLDVRPMLDYVDVD